MLPSLPRKYRDEVQGLLDGIIERRGDLGELTRGQMVLQALSVCAPGIEIIPLLEGESEPGHSTANAVFGAHTRDTREAGDVVTIGIPGFPGVSRTVIENRVLVSYRSDSPDEVSYAAIAFAGSPGLYSVGFSAEGVTLSGTAAAAGIERRALAPEPGWVPVSMMAREGAPPFATVFESTTNLVPGYPESVERGPGWDVLGEGDHNLDWRGDCVLMEGEILRRRDDVLLNLEGNVVAALTLGDIDGDGDPINGTITRNGVAGTWHRRPRGAIHGLGIITVDGEGQGGYYVLDDGEVWGSWKRTAEGEATFYDAGGATIGCSTLRDMGRTGVAGQYPHEGETHTFYAWKRHWDAELLDLNNIQWLPQVQRFIPKELHDANGYMTGDNR